MGKSLREKLLNEDKLILDTSFILPYVGLRVSEIGEEVMGWLKEADQYYPSMMIPELAGVIFRAAKKMRLDSIPEQALEGFNLIIYEDLVQLIDPMSEDLSMAYELVRKGLNDLFDAILYATSRRTGIKAITMDKSLVDFLEKNGFKPDNIILIT